MVKLKEKFLKNQKLRSKHWSTLLEDRLNYLYILFKENGIIKLSHEEESNKYVGKNAGKNITNVGQAHV